jgi:hypothetical protein
MSDDRARRATNHRADNRATRRRSRLISDNSTNCRACGCADYSAALLLTHSRAACEHYRARQKEPKYGP